MRMHGCPWLSYEGIEIDSEDIKSSHSRTKYGDRPKHDVAHVGMVRVNNDRLFTKKSARKWEPG